VTNVSFDNEYGRQRLDGKKKLKSVRKLHTKAMDLAELAFVVKLRGNLEEADQLSRQAFEYESKAARLVPDEPSSEPTRHSINGRPEVLREWAEVAQESADKSLF
jgi:hypothetical protein